MRVDYGMLYKEWFEKVQRLGYLVRLGKVVEHDRWGYVNEGENG